MICVLIVQPDVLQAQLVASQKDLANFRVSANSLEVNSRVFVFINRCNIFQQQNDLLRATTKLLKVNVLSSYIERQ